VGDDDKEQHRAEVERDDEEEEEYEYEGQSPAEGDDSEYEYASESEASAGELDWHDGSDDDNTTGNSWLNQDVALVREIFGEHVEVSNGGSSSSQELYPSVSVVGMLESQRVTLALPTDWIPVAMATNRKTLL
jgi:hypothetical protein